MYISDQHRAHLSIPYGGSAPRDGIQRVAFNQLEYNQILLSNCLFTGSTVNSQLSVYFTVPKHLQQLIKPTTIRRLVRLRGITAFNFFYHSPTCHARFAGTSIFVFSWNHHLPPFLCAAFCCRPRRCTESRPLLHRRVFVHLQQLIKPTTIHDSSGCRDYAFNVVDPLSDRPS